MIDRLELLDFLDGKFLEIRKSDKTFAEKITAYNLLIDVQEFIKCSLDEEIRRNRNE